MPYEQDDSDNEKQESSDEEGASYQDNNVPSSDEGDDEYPLFDEDDDEDEGMSYNGDDDNAANDSNDDDSDDDDDHGAYGPTPPLRARERIIVEDVSDSEDDDEDEGDDEGSFDAADVESLFVDDVNREPHPMGRGHCAKRHNVRIPTTQYTFLNTAFQDLNDDLHFQFMQQAVKDVKEKGDATLLYKYVTGLIFNQMSAKAGLKKHGERAWQALLKELHQLKDLDVFKVVHASTLTEQQKREALRKISVIKEK